MNTPNTFWHITLAGAPSPALLLWGNRVVCPVRSMTQTESESHLVVLDLVDGRCVWQHTFHHALVSGLTISGDQLLVSLTSTDLLRGEGALVALSVQGDVVWRWAPGVQQVSAPAVREDTAFVTVDATSLVAVDVRTGQEQRRWSLPVSASRSAPAIADDLLLIPCRALHLLALALNGTPRWRFDAPGTAWLDQTPVIVGNRIFAVLSAGKVVALAKADGAPVWQTDIGPAGKPLTAPVADGERLYVGARDGLYVLDLDGHIVWHLATERRITAAPVVVGGVVYATCHDHHLYALDAATGKELWRYAMERRIEVSPLVLSTDTTEAVFSAQSGETVEALALVADAEGNIAALARPLSAVEHEVAGHWREAASAYAELGQFARRAALLEGHGQPGEAARLWEAAGDAARAAAQYEVAGQWERAADLWAAQGQPLRQAEALQQHARSQEAVGAALEPLADVWRAIANLYETEREHALAAHCRREVARCLRQPDLALEIEHDGLVHNAWTMVNFIVRNVGFGPARNLFIRTSGRQFDGQVMRTQRLSSLDAGERAVEHLDIKPLEYGSSVPLQVEMEFVDDVDHLYTCTQTLHLPVSQTAPQERKTLHSRVITAVPDFVDMEVRVFPLEPGGYPVEITLGDEQNFPRGYLDAGLADWISSGNLATDGQQLFAALTADANLHNAWARARGQAPRRRIRLRIDLAAPELHVLPWELLQEDDLWLSANASTPLSRYIPVAEPWGEGVEERPLRVLSAVVNPTDLSEYGLPALDVVQEKAALEEAFVEVPDTTLHLDFLDAPITLLRLECALQEGYHILHIVGHGTFNARKGKGALCLQDDGGLTVLADDEALVAMLARQGARPRLVLLAACQSATRSTSDAFVGMASRLIASGVPAVIAMQASVSLTTTQQMSEIFYRRLVEHGAVDLALNEARSALLTANRPDAAVPVLYMRLQDGQLFRR
ncbi:MAG: PQQ-binding-like beta-propeller repeat protein [Anaerolineae bacterium]